jgi:flagellar L-ring protein precursor FlgH
MQLKYSALVVALLLSLSCICSADSLWNKQSSSPYSPDKSYKVGDVITVIIDENTNAQQKAGTNTNTKDDMSLQLNHTIAKLNPLIGGNSSVAYSGGNKYTGSGTTQRAAQVTSKIAATVIEVSDNGNLKIEGHHKLEVNDEMQDILVTGTVRSKDISVANSIFSYQVANAEVSVKGTGVIQEAESPGWLSRIFNWLF